MGRFFAIVECQFFAVRYEKYKHTLEFPSSFWSNIVYSVRMVSCSPALFSLWSGEGRYVAHKRQ
ncbi:MAG: hypothetical protein C1942_00715 [Prosthecochloris sp.]|nr:hypothetical protein [Prosthecochloris sp.]